MPHRKKQVLIHRHGRCARILHGINACAIVVLVLSGLALSDDLPAAFAARLGGHTAVNGAHRLLGLAFVFAALALAATLRGSARRLIGDLLRFRRRECHWPAAFLRQALAPSRHALPFHGGRFDPAERMVLAILLAATAVAGASGIYLYFLPPAPRWVLVLVMRAHIGSAWVMMIAACLHIVAGSGILPTHRGILRSMFGDGSLPLDTARRLWPGWTRRASNRGSQGGPGAPAGPLP